MNKIIETSDNLLWIYLKISIIYNKLLMYFYKSTSWNEVISGEEGQNLNIGFFNASFGSKFGNAINDEETVWNPISVLTHIADSGLLDLLY